MRVSKLLALLLGASGLLAACADDSSVTPLDRCAAPSCKGCCDNEPAGSGGAGSSTAGGGTAGSSGRAGAATGGAGGASGAGAAGAGAAAGGAAGAGTGGVAGSAGSASGQAGAGTVGGNGGAAGISGGAAGQSAAGASGSAGNGGQGAAPSTACPADILVPVDIQPNVYPPDVAGVLLASTPGASTTSKTADYRNMRIRAGNTWRFRLMVEPGDTTVGLKVPPTLSFGPEDMSSGMTFNVSLSRSCADFGPSAQAAPALAKGGSATFKTSSDPGGATQALVITEPGLWFVNVTVPPDANNIDRCGQGSEGQSCQWSFLYRAGKN